MPNYTPGIGNRDPALYRKTHPTPAYHPPKTIKYAGLPSPGLAPHQKWTATGPIDYSLIPKITQAILGKSTYDQYQYLKPMAKKWDDIVYKDLGYRKYDAPAAYKAEKSKHYMEEAYQSAYQYPENQRAAYLANYMGYDPKDPETEGTDIITDAWLDKQIADAKAKRLTNYVPPKGNMSKSAEMAQTGTPTAAQLEEAAGGVLPTTVDTAEGPAYWQKKADELKDEALKAQKGRVEAQTLGLEGKIVSGDWQDPGSFQLMAGSSDPLTQSQLSTAKTGDIVNLGATRLPYVVKREGDSIKVAPIANDPDIAKKSEGTWLDKKTAPLAHGLETVVDNISRGLYAGTAGHSYLLGQEDDIGTKDKGNVFGGGWNPLVAVDRFMGGGIGYSDMVADGSLKGYGKAVLRGLLLQEKKSNIDVLREAADKDPKHNMYDSKWYRAPMGFTEDMIYDPTSYVGVGVVKNVIKKPIKTAVRKAAGELALKDLTDEIAGYGVPRDIFANSPTAQEFLRGVEAGEGPNLTPRELHAILGGNLPAKFKSVAERKFEGRKVALHARAIDEHLAPQLEYGTPSIRENIKGWRKHQEGLQAVVDALRADRVAQLDRVQADAFESNIKEAVGADQFDETMDIAHVQRALSEDTERFMRQEGHHSYDRYVEKMKGWNREPLSKKAWLEERKPFDEALGESWLKSTDFTPEERKGLMASVRVELLNMGDELGDKSFNYKNLNAQIRDVNAEIKILKQQGRPVGTREARRNALYRNRDHLLSAAFLRAANNLKKTKATGELAYKDPARVAHLDEVIRRANETLEQPPLAHPGVTAGTEEREAFDFGTQPEHLESVFEPQRPFLDSHQQAQAIRTQAVAEKKKLESLLGGLEMRNVEIPKAFQQTDGAIKERLMERALYYSEQETKSGKPATYSIEKATSQVEGKAGLNRKLTPQEHEFLDTVIDFANHKYGERYAKSLQNKARRSSEAVKETVDRVTASHAFEEILKDTTDFRRALAVTLQDSFLPTASGRGRSFTVNIDGEAIQIGDPKFLDKIRQHVTKNDEKVSDRTAHFIAELKNGNEVPDSILKKTIEVLQETGTDIPTNPLFAKEWLKKNSVGLESISPERITFSRYYKSEHGSSLAEAYGNLRKVSTLDDAKFIPPNPRNPVFTSYWPNGMSKADFIESATSGPDGLWEAFAKNSVSPGYPVKVVPKFEKTPRSKKAVPEKTKLMSMREYIEYHKGKRPTNSDARYANMSHEEKAAALRKDIREYDSEYNRLGQKFTDHVWKWMEQNPKEALERLNAGWYQRTKAVERGRKGKILDAKGKRALEIEKAVSEREEAAALRSDLTVVNAEERLAMRKQAFGEGLKETIGDIGSVKYFDRGEKFQMASPNRTAEEMATMYTKAERIAHKRQMALLEQEKRRANSPEERQAVMAEINSAQLKYIHTQRQIDAATKESRMIRSEMNKRMAEDAVLRIIETEVAKKRAGLGFNVLGREVFKIQGPEMLYHAADRAAGVPGIAQARQAYAHLFKPASALPEEMQLARSRALSLTSDIISSAVRNLNKHLGPISKPQRIETLKALMHGTPVGPEGIPDAIVQELEKFLPYFNRERMVGSRALTPWDINRYLPDDMRLHAELPKGRFNNYRELMGAFNIKDTSKVDPLEFIWRLRIATEQAHARLGLQETLKNVYGVQRAAYYSGRAKGQYAETAREAASESDKALHDAVEKLHDMGWKAPSKLGDASHLFPPEVFGEIDKLMNMLEPRNIGTVGKFIDGVTGAWKTGVTVYNPPFWTRNAVGEIMVGYLGGVQNIKYYKRASQLMHYMTGHGHEIEALGSHQPWADYVPTGRVQGTRYAATVGNGERLNLEQVGMLYHDQGLKTTGYLSSDVERAVKDPSKAALTNNLGVRGVRAGDRKLKEWSEKAEDWPRMAHFMHSLEHAPKHMNTTEAAQYAAQQVRKYHFDYTDVTNFEKSAMMRLFPFYKWTRKALPMMMGTLFLKPGRVMAYPKAMNALSELTTDNMNPDENTGFMPSFSGIAPEWLQSMFLYQMGHADGQDVYGGIATPQMDALRTITHPLDTAYQMSNPMLKFFGEQFAGKTFGSMGHSLEAEPEQEKLRWNTMDEPYEPEGETSKRIGQVAGMLGTIPTNIYKQATGKANATTWWKLLGPSIQENPYSKDRYTIYPGDNPALPTVID